MSLLLFWPSTNIAPPVINTDYGFKPKLLSFKENKASILIDRTRAVFQESFITYNQTGLTYNDSNTLYGGSDNVDGIGPSGKIINSKASIKVDRTRAVFQNSIVTYSEAGLTYNDPNTFYGGADSVDGQGPLLHNIAIGKPKLKKIGN